MAKEGKEKIQNPELNSETSLFLSNPNRGLREKVLSPFKINTLVSHTAVLFLEYCDCLQDSGFRQTF